MEKKVMHSKRVPEAVGAYSQAIQYGGLLYSSGQIGLKPGEKELVPGGVKKQAEQALINIKNLLEDNGSSLEKVLKVTIYLTDMNDFRLVNELYQKFFLSSLPARSTVAVKSLPLGALIELDFIAYAT